MAITTLDGVVAGLQPPSFYSKNYTGNIQSGHMLSMWYQGGFPVNATANASGVSGAALTAPVTGQIEFKNPVSGNAYLSRFTAHKQPNNNSGGSFFILADRLWHNSGLDRTLTTAQTVNSAAWPARDINGSTNGEGVYIAVEISTAMGTGVPTITMSYTNSAGTAGRTATNIVATAASMVAGNFITLGLQAGDTGVRSVQSVTFSASWGTAGVLHLVAYRPIMLLATDATTNGHLVVGDAFTMGMPRMFNGSVPMLMAHSNSANIINSPAGEVQFAHG